MMALSLGVGGGSPSRPCRSLMRVARRILPIAVLLALLAGCNSSSEIPMEPWFVESQANTKILTDRWRDAGPIPGTGIFVVKGGLPLSDPTVPWLEPMGGVEPGAVRSDSRYHFSAGSGGIEMPEGSGDYYLVLPMSVAVPKGLSEPVECYGDAFVGQVAECGGWVVRVVEANAEGGAFVLLAHPDAPRHRLMWGPDNPVDTGAE
jgi:hypothetical protein